ncbi:hypothetical protein ACFU5B_17875 [Streptomyces murinus]|uniref:hypothetical protein n=1 Tax=Streptomyces murinus TaxID=33900 RepID=UPI00363129F4
MVGDERVGGQGADAAPVFGGSAEWGAAYEECEAEVRRFVPRLWTLIGTPVTHGGPSEERERRFARRAADTLADLRSGTAWIRYGGRSWTPCADGISTGR